MEWIASGISVISLLAFFGMVVRTHNNVGRYYQRTDDKFDKFKKQTDDTYVHVKVCDVIKSSTEAKLDTMTRDIAEVKLMVRELWQNWRNRNT